MSNELPSSWKGYGRPGRPAPDSWQAEVRRTDLEADDFGHANRELAFSQWLYRNTGIEWDIKGRLEDIADRKEWQV